MKRKKLSEENFEREYVVKTLVEKNSFLERQQEDFDYETLLDGEILLNFIKSTQEKEWQKFKVQYPANTEKRFLKNLSRQISKQGTLNVLRSEFKDRGTKFELAYYKPISGLNPEHKILYEQNRFSVIRQFTFSEKYHKTLDVVLFLNGIPIITAELKNIFSGQNYSDAVKQYKERDYNEPFLKRCLVHFALDNDAVYFTTRLQDDKTVFLPFNKGLENPDDPRGFKVSYLYYDLWQPDSLLEIIAYFFQFIDKKDKKTGKKQQDIIFPRFHQVQAVRELIKAVRAKGTGKNYLVQHSTGSGKTYTISWLAHQLSKIHDKEDRRVFDSVIVVSDRRVIDKQLRQAVIQFEKTPGVVLAAEKSTDLRKALESGKNIIVTTVQKFTFVVDEIKKRAGHTFAVIIDEAHSSQGGETMKSVKKTLVYSSLEEAEAEEPKEIDIEEKILQDIKSRGKLPNVGFFAFTATPKPQTLELFGEPKADGTYLPFSLYSMRQAITEGFIVDVLSHYITYKTYFKLIKKIEEDPKYDKSKAAALLKHYVDIHPHSIEKKTKIILDHFNKAVKNKIGGKAKAMLVTRSRKHVLRYKLEFDRQLKENKAGYKALAAFTHEVEDGDIKYTEAGMNGFPESRTKEKFEEDKYRFLIAAEKFQTGFDQPLLQTMYVDKVLKGLHAVQTLGRANRQCPGKDEVYILDFVNETDDMKKAFQPYYQTTMLEEGTDPNILYELERQIKSYHIIEIREVEKFVKLWYTSENQAKLHKTLSPAESRYGGLAEEEKSSFRDTLRKFLKIYAFVAQVATFTDADLEKLYIYCRFLLKKISQGRDSLPREVLENVDMDSYRIKKTGTGTGILMEEKDGELKYGELSEKKDLETEYERLSIILKHINEAHGSDFTADDKVKIQKINTTIKEDVEFQESKRTNPKSALKLLFEEMFERILGDMYESDFNFYEKIRKDPGMKGALKEKLFEEALI